MHTDSSTPTTSLRMPRQAPGVHRGTSGTAALGAGGVEAAGLFSWLAGLLGLPDEVGNVLDTAGNIGLSFVPGGTAFGEAVSPFIP
jgi:hypothetical protein